MKKSRFPHSLVLIFAMIVVAQLITYVVPSGEYQRQLDERLLSDDDRRLELPEGVRLLLPSEGRILLADGADVRLPAGCEFRTPSGHQISINSQRSVTIDGQDLTLATRNTLVDAAGRVIHMPADGCTIELPAGRQVAGGAVALDGAAIVLPKGAYTTKEGRRIDPDSFRELSPEESPTLPWHASLTKIPKGMEAGAEIIFFVFIVGGVIGVIRATGAIDALLGSAIRRFGHNRPLLIGVMVTVFAVGSSTIGMAEEYMPFIPILVTMCLALKLDAVVAVGIVYVGAGIGYGAAALNPFTVAIAKDIAGTDLMLGMGWRWLLLALLLVIGIHHILRYAKRITLDPERSLVRDVDYSEGFEMPEDVAFTARRSLVVTIFAGGIAFFVVGVALWGWYLTELAAIFLAMAILAAVLGKLHINTVAERFCHGAAELTTTALLIGFARTIEVVLTDGKVIHTVVNGISGTLNQLGSPALSANGMLIIESTCNFLIPSGSGQAFVTMPIMAPVAELTGVGPETAVLAYQFGDGFTNMVVPTNALLMGMLALAFIPYQRWLRFVLPLLGKIYLVAIIVLAIAGSAGFGLD